MVRRMNWRVLVFGVVLALVAVVGLHLSGHSGWAAAQTRIQSDEIQKSPGFARTYEVSNAFREVSKASLPAVVSIKTKGKVVRQRISRGPSPFDDPFFRRFFDDPRFRGNRDGQPLEREFRTPGGMGSGFIIDADGVVMTNAHVVDDAEEVIVRLADGREVRATDIKTDSRSDVAVMRIKVDEKLPFLPLGDDDRMEIGDWVLAFGSPFGLHHSVTQGIISAKSRGLGGDMPQQDFIQTDAAVNPGNSGGPLVNLRGEVVGINTAISTRSGGYDGVSLAVPVNLAKWVAGQLQSNGKVRRAYVGILMQPVDAELAPEFNLRLPRGVIVTDVVEASPADKAGFQEGDVILEVNGRPISNSRNMLAVVERLTIGKTYTIRVKRGEREVDLRITVEERPDDLAERAKADSNNPSTADEESSEFDDVGFTVQNLTQDLAEQLNVSGRGVVITSVAGNSPADEARLAAGMVITRAGNTVVERISDLEKAIKSARRSRRLLLLVKFSNGNSNVSQFVTVRLGNG